MTPFDEAIQRSDLRARGQIARFGLQDQEEWFQTTLPVAPLARPATNGGSDVCGHAGTARVPQRRLFGGGWVSTCGRCGQEV